MRGLVKTNSLILWVENLLRMYRCKNPFTQTCPCNGYPLKPQFYTKKLGFAGVYLFFLFLLQNIDCGYLLEPPHQRGGSRRGGSNVHPQSMFLRKKKKNIKIFLPKIFIFYNFKNLCILHGQVFVMHKVHSRRPQHTTCACMR